MIIKETIEFSDPIILNSNIVDLVPRIGNIILPYDYKMYHPYTYKSPAVISYPDLNEDEEILSKIMYNLWNKLIKLWIYDYLKIINYVTGSKGNYRLVDNIQDANSENQNIELENKIRWFFNNIYTKRSFFKSIIKYKKYMNIDIWDIDKEPKYLKKFLIYEMKKRILRYYK